MFANGPDQQFYQTPAPSQQQQQQPGQSQQQHPSVIVRQPELPDDPDETGYAASASCYGFTSPVVPTYSTYPIPLLFPDWNQFGMFTQQSPADSNCSSTLAPPLTSPIGNPAIGNRLNPLAPPGFGYPRGPLPYDLNPQYMGGARKTGGRRPKEFEMGPEIEDQEELDKKLKRRQRNKEAAARCRQRRLDLMTNLQEQVDRFKAENEEKERQIRDMKTQMAQMESFLRSHDCKMSVEERESLLNMPAIRTTMPPVMNGISTNQQHPVSDYRPNIEVNRKRVLPAPQLPAHSDANFLEPDIKCPKIEKDVSLADLNGDPTITRPNHINFEGIGLGNNHAPLSTPSNITYTSSVPYTTPNNYTPGFPGLNNDFLNDSTGLTPCTTQNPIFVSTPTPLQTSEADLRAL